MVRHKPWSPVLVTIGTTVEEFSPVECIKVAFKKTTWYEVLVSGGILMDPKKYCLKSANLRTVLLHDEKVSDFVASFKRTMKEYKVKLVEMTPADRRKVAEKRGRKRRSRQPAPRSSEPGTGTNPGDSGATPSTSRGGPENPGFYQRFYHEFPAEMDYRGQEANQGTPNGAEDAYFYDAVSQDSQDSQNELEDIKPAVINRLIKGIPNSVLHSIKGENQRLKERQNFMKIARLLPLTVNFLDHIFQGL